MQVMLQKNRPKGGAHLLDLMVRGVDTKLPTAERSEFFGKASFNLALPGFTSETPERQWFGHGAAICS